MSALSVIMLGTSKSCLRPNAKFSFDEEVRLAHEVEKRPILWDATKEIYKRSDLKDQVWEEVSRCIGFQFSSNDVSTRFKAIKDTFMKNQRKIEESKSKCSGAGAADIYKPKWCLYTSFLFLKKICVQAASTSSIPASIIVECDVEPGSSVSPSNEPELTPLEEDNLQFEDSSLWEPRSGPTSPNLLVSSRPVSASTPISKRPAQTEVGQLNVKRGQTKKTNAYLMEEAVNVMRDISKQPIVPPLAARPDHEEIFASFIASRLRNMHAEKKKECENEILSVLLQYR